MRRLRTDEEIRASVAEDCAQMGCTCTPRIRADQTAGICFVDIAHEAHCAVWASTTGFVAKTQRDTN